MLKIKNIIGHQTQLSLLERWLEHPAAGYVFHGPAHVGKKTIARQFVSGLLLNTCPLELHPDVIILEPLEGKTMISVEDVRHARARLAERPMVAPRRVFYLSQADRLNEEGMNALLKVFEEPPAGAVFVCVVERLDALLPTLRSRSVCLPFYPVPTQEMEQGGISSDRAQAAHGRPGWAIEPVDDRAIKIAQEFLQASSIGQRLMVIERVSKVCDDASDTSLAWRAMLETWTTGTFKVLMDPISPAKLLFLHACVIAWRMIGGAVSPRVALEAAAIKMQGATMEDVRGLLPQILSSYPSTLFS